MINKSQEINEQIAELERWMKTHLDYRELKRAITVKLSLQGWTYQAIASLLKISNSSISEWKNRFKQEGIEGLKLSYKGAKSYLTKEQKQQVITWLQENE